MPLVCPLLLAVFCGVLGVVTRSGCRLGHGATCTAACNCTAVCLLLAAAGMLGCWPFCHLTAAYPGSGRVEGRLWRLFSLIARVLGLPAVGFKGNPLSCIYHQRTGCWDGCFGLFRWLALRSQCTTTCAVVQPCAGGCQRWAGLRALLCCSRLLRAAAGDLEHAIARCGMLYTTHTGQTRVCLRWHRLPMFWLGAVSTHHKLCHSSLGWWCGFFKEVSSSCPATRVFHDVC